MINTMKDAHKYIVSKIKSSVTDSFLNWSHVERRLKNSTVESGSDCGRYIIVKVGSFFYRIDDGAHNCYMIMNQEPKQEWLNRDVCKIVALAIADNCKVKVTCDGETDLENSTTYNQVVEALEVTDDILNIHFYKRTYKGTFSTSEDMQNDESIIDYTVNKYCENLFNQVFNK
jgi:hypothetical protein